MDSSPRIVMGKTEAEVVPGETARYPFVVRTGGHLPSAAEFRVSSDQATFDPRWARVVRTTDDRGVTSYLLEVTPEHVPRDQYGRYPLCLRCEEGGDAEARCELVIKPGVRLTSQPDLSTWPGGKLTLSIENFGHSDVDVDVSLEHHGSSWSQGWDVELEADSGPVSFSEEFDPPEGGRRGTFTVTVSAAGVPVAEAEVHGRKWALPRQAAIIAAVLALGAALGGGALAVTGLSGHPSGQPGQSSSPSQSVHQVRHTRGSSPTQSVTSSGGGSGNGSGGRSGGGGSPTQGDQVITFTTTPPASAAPGDTYPVQATGGASGEQVKVTIDDSSASVCSYADGTVTFNQVGNCLIDANQTGNAQYLAAAQAQQAIAVAQLTQTITITSTPPADPIGDRNELYTVMATGGPSDEPVTFSIEGSTSASAPAPPICTISGSTVTFNRSGTCVIDANQAGDNRYAAAPQVQQTLVIGR